MHFEARLCSSARFGSQSTSLYFEAPQRSSVASVLRCAWSCTRVALCAPEALRCDSSQIAEASARWRTSSVCSMLAHFCVRKCRSMPCCANTQMHPRHSNAARCAAKHAPMRASVARCANRRLLVLVIKCRAALACWLVGVCAWGGGSKVHSHRKRVAQQWGWHLAHTELCWRDGGDVHGNRLASDVAHQSTQCASM